MPTITRQRILAVDALNSEWRTLGRAPRSVAALERLARRDTTVQALVPLVCATPFDLLTHMREAKGTATRTEAAQLVRVMLRESADDPTLVRWLVQALLPGLFTVATRLRWGQGGDWENGAEFFGELLSTTWAVLSEWSGQDRPYAVLDLLSAIRCRLRRQLLHDRDHHLVEVQLTTAIPEPRASHFESDLEVLTRALIDLHHEGRHADDVAVLYAHHVLGYSIAELATSTGKDRRSLYSRRDRGQRTVCA